MTTSTTWACPTCLKSIEKVDDYTVKFTLNEPNAPFMANLAMDFATILSAEYADAMMKAGTPEKFDQEPVGTGPFQFVDYQKDAVIRYKANPDYWGGKRRSTISSSRSPGRRRRAMPSCKADECQVDALPEPGRPRRDEEGSRRQPPVSRQASMSAISPSTSRSRPSTRRRCARRSTWRSTRTPS